MKPLARREEIVLRELPEELLVYDSRSHRVHCLNRTAAEVYRLADGSRSVAELATALDATVGARDERLVWAALRELEGAELMERCPAPADPAASRRAALKRIGLGTVVPLVVSILAPTPAVALASGCIPETSCGDPGVTFGVTQCYVLDPSECGTQVCIDATTCV